MLQSLGRHLGKPCTSVGHARKFVATLRQAQWPVHRPRGYRAFIDAAEVELRRGGCTGSMSTAAVGGRCHPEPPRLKRNSGPMCEVNPQ